jgi:hypothetical protein
VRLAFRLTLRGYVFELGLLPVPEDKESGEVVDAVATQPVGFWTDEDCDCD